MNRVACFLLITASASVLSVSAMAAGKPVSTECRKRMSDGDVIADNTSKLPQLNSGFTVVSFKAKRTSDGWSYGPCVLRPR